MRSISWFLFLLIHYWCIEMQSISVHWFYMLRLCWIHGSVLAVLLVESFGIFPYRVSCHLQRVEFWLPPCQFGWFLFLCVVWLLRLRLPILCWIIVVRMNIPVVFLTLGGSSQFFPIEDDIGGGSFVYKAFMILRYDHSIPSFLRVFIKKGCCILSNAFSASTERIIWFLSFLLLMWWITLIVWRILNQPCMQV